MRREGDDMSVRSPGPGRPDDAARKANAEQLRELQKQRQSRVVKAVVAIAIAVILILFIVQNSQHVPVDFVFFTRHPRLIWIMFTCSILGGIIGFLLGRPGKQVRLRRGKDEPPKR
jgi:uncharacterized integral membrane protein